MGKIVVTEFVSMDGVVEAPGGDGDYKHAGWTNGISSGDEGNKFKYEELMQADVQLLGRVTYRGVRGSLARDGRSDGRLWPQDERHAEVRRVLDPEQRRLEELHRA